MSFLAGVSRIYAKASTDTNFFVEGLLERIYQFSSHFDAISLDGNVISESMQCITMVKEAID